MPLGDTETVTLDTDDMSKVIIGVDGMPLVFGKWTEEQRLALLNAEINKTHTYRGVSRGGKEYVFAHMPFLTHLVVIQSVAPVDKQHILGSPIVTELEPDVLNVTDDLAIAHKIVESVTAENKIPEVIELEVIEDVPDGG